MKIIMIGHKFVPSRQGGVEIVVDRLSSIMAKNGNEVTIFNRKRKQKINEYNGCKVKSIFTINKKSLDAIVYAFFATCKAKKMARKENIDVIHYHAEGPCFFLNLFPKKRNYKIVVTIHGLDWQRSKWGGFASSILKKAEKKIVKYADEIIVLSKSNQEYFKTTYHKDTTYIPNGVDQAYLKDADIIKKEYALVKNSYILFLARIVPEKGLHYLLSSWDKIKSTTDKKLVIAGGSSHSSSYYKEICERVKNDNSIIMTGFVEGEKLQELYSNAYLYVLPSDIEGMPISLLEAISYGNICLVSDIKENLEVINKDCYVFKKGDVNSLKEQLEYLIKQNLSTHVNMIVNHSWEEVYNQTMEVYRK